MAHDMRPIEVQAVESLDNLPTQVAERPQTSLGRLAMVGQLDPHHMPLGGEGRLEGIPG